MRLAACPPFAALLARDGRVRWASQHFAALFGRGAAELIGRELASLVKPAPGGLHQLLRDDGGRIDVRQHIDTVDDGARIDTIHVFEPQPPSAGPPSSDAAVVPARGAPPPGAQHGLHRLIAETARIGTWDYDLSGARARWDASLFALHGLAAADAAPNRAQLRALVHPDDRAAFDAGWQQMLQADHAVEFEYRVLRQQQGPAYLNTRALALRDAGGTPVQAIGATIDVTTRRVAHQQLHQADERMRLASAATGLGSYHIGVGGGTIECDPQMLRLLGFEADRPPTLDEVLARTAAADRARQNLELLARSGDGATKEWTWNLARPQGERRELYLRSTLSRDPAGREPVIVGIAMDVSERRRIEREREDLTHRMELVSRVSGLGLWDIDLLAEQTHWNDQLFELLGRSRDFDPARWLETVHPEDRDRVAREFRAAIRMAVNHEGEFRVLLPDRRIRWLAVRTHTQRDVLGNAVRALGLAWDVTPLHQIESRLRNTLERLTFTTAAAGLGLWELERGSGDFRPDESMCRLYGWTPDQTPHTLARWLDSIHPDDRAAALESQQRALADGTVLNREWRVRGADGRLRTIAHSARSVERPDAGPRQIGVCWDVTDRVAGEQARRDKEAAERANAAKSEFLSRASHELRTPMNAIVGFAQILEGDLVDPLSAPQAQRVAQIRTAAHHLLTLIDDLLDLSRIDSGADTLRWSVVALQPLLENAIAMVGADARARGLAILLHAAPPEALEVRADRVRLKQVLLNLLSNAVKYNRAGGTIEVSATVPDAQHVAIAVTDTGDGIAAEHMERLFQPFDRLGRERGPIEGTGIGLSIARRLVENMQGRLLVDSRVGVGSTFTVVLRRSDGVSATR